MSRAPARELVKHIRRRWPMNIRHPPSVVVIVLSLSSPVAVSAHPIRLERVHRSVGVSPTKDEGGAFNTQNDAAPLRSSDDRLAGVELFSRSVIGPDDVFPRTVGDRPSSTRFA